MTTQEMQHSLHTAQVQLRAWYIQYAQEGHQFAIQWLAMHPEIDTISQESQRLLQNA